MWPSLLEGESRRLAPWIGTDLGSRLDGTLRCYDILTSTLLRTFKDRTATRLPARMLAAGLLDQADEERWKVSLIEAGKDSVVAAIGGRILAWQVDGDVLKKRAAKAGSGKMSARTERVRGESRRRSQIGSR
jgi:hypothetical protein